MERRHPACRTAAFQAAGRLEAGGPAGWKPALHANAVVCTLMSPLAEVVFYTRRDCSLCDKARAAIRESGVAVRMTEIDIEGDSLLQDLYTDHVPVIFVNGKEAFRHFVYAEEFAARILAPG